MPSQYLLEESLTYVPRTLAKAIGPDEASAIESETQNLGPEIDIEEQNRNIARLAQMLRGKRGGGANIAPVQPLKCVVERSPIFVTVKNSARSVVKLTIIETII